MDKDVLWQQQASLDNNECTINILKFMWYDGEGSWADVWMSIGTGNLSCALGFIHQTWVLWMGQTSCHCGTNCLMRLKPFDHFIWQILYRILQLFSVRQCITFTAIRRKENNVCSTLWLGTEFLILFLMSTRLIDANVLGLDATRRRTNCWTAVAN